MRFASIAVAVLLSHACSHVPLVGQQTAPEVDHCETVDPCWTGSGSADQIVSIAVVGAIVGVVGVHAIRRLLR